MSLCFVFKVMSRKRSAIWDYFVINPSDEITVLCITCDEAISRSGKDSKNFNSTNMRSHLRRAHHEKFDELEVKQHEAEADKDEQVMKRRKLSETCQLTLKELKEQKDPWHYDNSEHKKGTRWIAEMMAVSSQPFSIVEDIGFIRLMANVCPRYSMPSRKYFTEKIIPDMYSTIKARLLQDIDGKFSISFTTDIWSREAGGDSFISWTAYYINPESFVREKRVLQVCPFLGSHTAITISEMVTKLLGAWYIEKSRVHVVIRDNAANMVAGIRECELPAIGCAIHTLQLVVKNSIMIQRTVIDMLARCRKIVGHFKHSSLAYQHLRNIQSQLSLPEHKLIQDEPTCWDSTYYMLSCIIQQRRAITLYDTDFGLPEQLNSNGWQQAEKIVKLLEPVQSVTKELSGKDVMLSQVIPFIEILKMEMGSTGDDDRSEESYLLKK